MCSFKHVDTLGFEACFALFLTLHVIYNEKVRNCFCKLCHDVICDNVFCS